MPLPPQHPSSKFGHYEVTDEQAEHYTRLKEDRGWDWETLARSFEEHSYRDPASSFLATWARAQGGDKSARADKGTERAAKRTRGETR